MLRIKNVALYTGKLLIWSLLISLPFVSCSPDREQEIKAIYIDSLKNLEFENEILLNIDADKLKSRVTQIDRWYVRAADTSFDVAQKLISELTGVKTIYYNYINTYFPYEASNAALKEEMKSFYAGYKEMDKQEFKKKYALYKNEIESINQKLEPISQPVYEVEYTFKRLEKVFVK